MNKRRSAVIALLIILLLIVWWRMRRQKPASELTVRYAAKGEVLSSPFPAARLQPVNFPPNVAHEPPPVIDEIILEKSEVCEGEENLVRVRAHTVNGTDEFLHAAVGPEEGMAAPVLSFKRSDNPGA